MYSSQELLLFSKKELITKHFGIPILLINEKTSFWL